MKLMQPPVHPPPPTLSLHGKTALITGASAGLGFETALQLLTYGASVILAVRNLKKGEICKRVLLDDMRVRRANPRADVRVMALDMASFDSVRAFADRVRDEVGVLDLVVLNAGDGGVEYGVSADGHERIVQVNYWANVLLVLELVPLLERSAEITGKPARITWVGSRSHRSSALEGKSHLLDGEGVMEHFDARENFSYRRYRDSKLLCAMFIYEIAPRLDRRKVEINMVCPGMVRTEMGSDLPLWMLIPVRIVQDMRGRSVQEGTWMILHSAVVAGPESHGMFLEDKKIEPIDEFISSADGQKLQKKLWAETLQYMKTLTVVPKFLMWDKGLVGDVNI